MFGTIIVLSAYGYHGANNLQDLVLSSCSVLQHIIGAESWQLDGSLGFSKRRRKPYLKCIVLVLIIRSGFYPGVIFYMTLFYKRTELAGRLGAFFAAGSIANAFTGLIAYGV